MLGTWQSRVSALEFQKEILLLFSNLYFVFLDEEIDGDSKVEKEPQEQGQ